MLWRAMCTTLSTDDAALDAARVLARQAPLRIAMACRCSPGGSTADPWIWAL